MLKSILIYSVSEPVKGEGRLIGRASFHPKERFWVTQEEIEAVARPIAECAADDAWSGKRIVLVTCGPQCFVLENV